MDVYTQLRVNESLKRSGAVTITNQTLNEDHEDGNRRRRRRRRK